MRSSISNDRHDEHWIEALSDGPERGSLQFQRPIQLEHDYDDKSGANSPLTSHVAV